MYYPTHINCIRPDNQEDKQTVPKFLCQPRVVYCWTGLEADEAIRFSLLNEKSNVINYEEIHTGNGAGRARPVELEKTIVPGEAGTSIISQCVLKNILGWEIKEITNV